MAQDQNSQIIKLITERMELGQERYGHGVRVDDDTTQWGTKQDSWAEMALEEVLDGMIYMAAQLIRVLNQKDTTSTQPKITAFFSRK